MIFFEGSVPDFIECIDGKMETTAEQHKHGTQSLKWNYKDGSQLRFHVPIGYAPIQENSVNQERYAFALYLFGTGSGGTLTVSFCKEGRICCYFEILLGFTGWRNVSAGFDRDMKGTPEFGMDELVIEVHGDEGCLLLDEIVTANRMDYRHIMASFQTPQFTVQIAPIIKDWTLKSCYHIEEIYDEDFKHIRDVMESYIVEEFPCSAQKREELMEQVASLGIVEGQFGPSGKRIEHAPQRNQSSGLVGARSEYANLRWVSDLLRNLAVCWHTQPDASLETAYLKVLRFLMLQGFAEGSTMGTHAILDYALRPLYHSVLIMRDAIYAAGLSQELFRAMRWFLHMGGRGFLKDQPRDWATADDFNNVAQGMLITILFMEKPQPAADWLIAYRDWLSDNMQFTDGLRDLFKEDGCIYHHAGHYLAYGQGAIEGIAPVVYALTGTGFDIPFQAWQNMKHVLLNMRFQCGRLNYPIAFSGRHPLGTWNLSLSPFKYFALSALRRYDDQMVSVYLRLMELPQNQTDHILAAFARAEKTPQGNRSYPYACANVHRRGKWVVVTKGFSRYLWGSETYRGSNMYGRYRSYGVVEMVHEDGVREGGFSHDGYDWNHFPGATNIVLPWEQLRTQVHNVDSFSGFEEMLLGSESFAGSLSLDGNGMFSMILTEHPKYDGSFRAYKSVFLIDHFILLLGCGIQNTNSCETETTLYQNVIRPGDMPPQIGGKMITGEMVMNGEDLLVDNRGHIYYLPKGTRIRLRSGNQKSMSSTGDKETEGAFVIGSILHGTAPQDASYVYGIGIGGAPALPYQILRQDNLAHVAKVGDFLCVSLFAPGEAEGIESDTPIMIMLRETETGVHLAVCNPDLGLYDEDPSQFDENGVQREVSIYSRSWKNNPVGTKRVHLRLPGQYHSTDGLLIEEDGDKTHLTLDLKGGNVMILDLMCPQQ